MVMSYELRAHCISNIARLIRDALVEKVWEGTINVCALDLVRAASKDPRAVEHYISVSGITSSSLYLYIVVIFISWWEVG